MPPSWAPGEYGHGVPRRIIRAVGPCWARSGAGRVSRREGLPFVHGRPGPSCGGRDDPQRARHAVPNGARTRSPIRARSAPWRHRLQAPLGLLLLHGVLRARGGQQGLAASVGGVPSASTTGPEPGTKRLGERQEARAAQLLPAPPEAMPADTHADFAGGSTPPREPRGPVADGAGLDHSPRVSMREDHALGQPGGPRLRTAVRRDPLPGRSRPLAARRRPEAAPVLASLPRRCISLARSAFSRRRSRRRASRPALGGCCSPIGDHTSLDGTRSHAPSPRRAGTRNARGCV
jgi:hypothetical protein